MLRDLIMDDYSVDDFEPIKMIKHYRKKVYEARNKITKEEVIIEEVNEFEAVPMFNDFKKFYLRHHIGFVNILNLQFITKNESYQGEEKEEKKKLVIIYEKMANGTLSQPLHNYLISKDENNQKMNPTIRNKIIFGIASIVNYCLEKNIPFKELNPSNIFLDDNYEPHLSIGISIYYYTNLFITCVFTTPIFQPPEYFPTKEKHAVYQYGAFLYLMFTEIKRTTRKIIKVSTIPEIYWNLIERCLKEDPKERPTMKQIVDELKGDQYLIEEFGMKADTNEVKQYQRKIENDETINDQFSTKMKNVYQLC